MQLLHAHVHNTLTCAVYNSVKHPQYVQKEEASFVFEGWLIDQMHIARLSENDAAKMAASNRILWRSADMRDANLKMARLLVHKLAREARAALQQLPAATEPLAAAYVESLVAIADSWIIPDPPALLAWKERQQAKQEL